LSAALPRIARGVARNGGCAGYMIDYNFGCAELAPGDATVETRRGVKGESDSLARRLFLGI